MVISCSYKKRVGKDTFFLLVQELYPDHKIVRIAFADELKNEVFKCMLEPNGFDKSFLDNPDTKEVFRPLLQGWGTVRREFSGEDYWVERAFNKMTESDTIYIICDCRYLNELNFVNSHNGYTVHIKRDSVVQDNSHSSETALDDYHHLFQYTVLNNGTTEDYKVQVEKIMQDIFEKEKERLKNESLQKH